MYKHLLSIITLIICCCNLSLAQILNLQARSLESQSGSQIIESLSNLSLQERETYIFNELTKGNIPDFYRKMIPITDSSLIDEKYKKIIYYVVPDYLALGVDTDFFMCPMTPILAQKIADTLKCSLPTRKMVNQIWKTASVKMLPEPILPSPEMTTVPVFALHNKMVWRQRQHFIPNEPLGCLVSGHKKDLVISNLIISSPPPGRVVIYGWHYPTGKNIQPLYAGHNNAYADYSHGTRLVQNEVYVDNNTLLIKDVLKSLSLNPLLSDEGVIAAPYYPDK